MNTNIPMTKDDAFKNGKKATHEGHNPYRNRGFEFTELNTAWLEGFESRNK